MSDGCIFLWFKASIWVVFVTAKLDFSAGSEWEKDCKNQPVKAIFLHVTFSLRWKNAYRGKKKKKREEHVFLPFKERLCYLSSKLGIEQPFFLNREFSTVVYFLKKTCFLQVMYMVLTVVALQVTNWSPSTTWFAINTNISESDEYLSEKPTPKDAKIPI